MSHKRVFDLFAIFEIFGSGGGIPPEVLNWILSTGFWRDTGVWDDTANWID